MNKNNQKVDTMDDNTRSNSFDSACKAQQALGFNTESIRELPFPDTLKRLSQLVYDEMQNSKRGQKLLLKAEQYNMPIDRDNIDWHQLMDDINVYERLLKEASELGISWDTTYYDPVPLQDEIDEAKLANYEYERELLSDFHASRGVMGV
jgi:hypothetical protein